MKLSLKNRILKYLQKRDYFVASGDIQRLAMDNGFYSPQNAGRRLRELCEEGILVVEYRKGHAFYKYENNQNKVRPTPVSHSHQTFPKMLALW